MTNDIKQIIIILIATALISGLGGFILKGYLSGNNIDLPLPQKLNTPSKETSPAGKDQFFSAQTATVDGVITKSSDSKITIKNSKGEIKEFPISTNVLTIYGFNEKSKTATSTPKLKEIVTDKPVLVNLGFIDNEYRVVSVTYLPESKSQSDAR